MANAVGCFLVQRPRYVSPIAAIVLLAGHSALAETKLSHRLELEWAVETEETESQKGELEWQPRLESDLGKTCQFLLQLRLRGDWEDRLAPGQPDWSATYSELSEPHNLGDHGEGELRELWFRCSSQHFFLTLGKQQTVWGKSDGLKILDVVNPQSFREFILEDYEDSRIPLWTASAELQFGNTNLQLLWIPDPTHHELPLLGSPYEFTAPRLVPTPPPDVPALLLPIDRPDDPVEDADWGARLSTFIGGFDLSFIFLDQYDDAPVFARSFSGGPAAPTLLIEPTYRRSQLLGGTFSNAFGALTLRGEVGWRRDKALTTQDPADADGLVTDDELAYVLGLDWFGIENVLISFQFFRRELSNDLPFLLQPHTDTNFTGLVRWTSRRERLRLELIALHGDEQNDGLVRPKLTWAWSDKGQLFVGYDLFYGDAAGLFGQFDHRDRARLGLRFDL